MKRSEAYKRGYEAYLGPMKGKLNPFQDGSTEHREWWEGFNDAQADYSV